jgi:hypothetical protein
MAYDYTQVPTYIASLITGGRTPTVIDLQKMSQMLAQSGLSYEQKQQILQPVIDAAVGRAPLNVTAAVKAAGVLSNNQQGQTANPGVNTAALQSRMASPMATASGTTPQMQQFVTTAAPQLRQNITTAAPTTPTAYPTAAKRATASIPYPPTAAARTATTGTTSAIPSYSRYIGNRGR